jgi:hypothetical protein
VFPNLPTSAAYSPVPDSRSFRTYPLQPSSVKISMALLEDTADKDSHSEHSGGDDGTLPPSYSVPDLTVDNIRGPQAQCTHTYKAAPNSAGQPWFTLEVLSNATSAKNKPYFIGTLPMRVTGCVRLSLTPPERIIRVKVSVRFDTHAVLY